MKIRVMKKINIIIGAVIVIAVIAIFFWVKSVLKSNYIEIGSNDKIEPTPTQIQSIRDIGEWEFLSISAEEMVDTVRKGFFSDDELVRIYYGTLRLGINMHQARPHWLTVSGDTATAVLPKVGLLDKNFIDEARTKSFYESGSWQESDREALYKKAYRMMLQRCMTPTNLKAAEENAEAQFRKMLLALGYKNVIIKFER